MNRLPTADNKSTKSPDRPNGKELKEQKFDDMICVISMDSDVIELVPVFDTETDETNIIDENALEIKYKIHIENLNNNIIEYEKELDTCTDIINELKKREDILLAKLNRSNNGLRLLMKEEEIRKEEINNLIKNNKIKEEMINQLNKDKHINRCRMNDIKKEFEKEVKQIKLNLYTPILEFVHTSEQNIIDYAADYNKILFKPQLEIELENNYYKQINVVDNENINHSNKILNDKFIELNNKINKNGNIECVSLLDDKINKNDRSGEDDELDPDRPNDEEINGHERPKCDDKCDDKFTDDRSVLKQCIIKIDEKSI
eukprot:206502_1